MHNYFCFRFIKLSIEEMVFFVACVITRRQITIIMGKRLIQNGGIMMTLMNIFGKDLECSFLIDLTVSFVVFTLK